jgi:hypothetical protein
MFSTAYSSTPSVDMDSDFLLALNAIKKGEKGKGKFARRSRGGILFAKVTAWPKKYS